MTAAFPEAKNGPRAKIERAREHLQEFEQAVSEFLAQEPYTLIVHEEPRDGLLHRVWRCRINQTPPIRLSTIAGDVLYCARSALDLLACQFVVAGGGSVHRASFPFGKSKEIFEQELKKKVKKAPALTKRFIKRLKPYNHGNGTLYRLHGLNLMDKHRLLLPVGAINRSTTIGFATMGLNITWRADELLNEGEEVLAFPVFPGVPEDLFNFDIRFEVRLVGPDGLLEEAAPVLLRRLVDHTDKIVAIAERKLLK